MGCITSSTIQEDDRRASTYNRPREVTTSSTVHRSDSETTPSPKANPQHGAPPRDTKALLQQIKHHGATSCVPRRHEECCICLGEMTTATVLTLPCSHVFHEGCIESWLERQTSCPYCCADVLAELAHPPQPSIEKRQPSSVEELVRTIP